MELIYPFITHFPLAVLLCVLNKKYFWPMISQNIHISESDLCILLSNVLENALHACQG